MSLSIEWVRRIEHWERVMPECFYHPLGQIQLSGFVTRDQLTPQEASQRSFKPMPAGTAWGAKWEYGWFQGSITLPAETTGQRVVVRLEPGAESIVWVNDQAAGAKDWAHMEITLTYAGNPGEQYRILLECYAGHGPREVGGGPVPYGTVSVPEAAPAQVVVGESTFGIWDEAMYQL